MRLEPAISFVSKASALPIRPNVLENERLLFPFNLTGVFVNIISKLRWNLKNVVDPLV